MSDTAPTSRHLRALADHVRAGAHVVLRGHVGDEALLDGEVREELWAIGRVLADEAGIEAVVVVNQADGPRCLDEGDEARVAAALQAELQTEESPAMGAELGATGAFHVASAIRALLRQEELTVAVVVQDALALGDRRDSQERRAIGVVVEAMAEAGFGGTAEAPVRNTLIVYGDPPSPASQALAAVPGVVEHRVAPPDRAERLAALRCLAPGFRGGQQPAEERDLESLARLTHGSSVRELEQLRRRSHHVDIPISRPEALFRAARRERRGTLIDDVGVPTIVAMLEEEIVGQPRAMRAIEERLERGRWRSAHRPPGSTPTRPMATMVLHGPAGVGKTETGYILAEALVGSRDAVRRIDCAELTQQHDIARLTGAPPGYVGYEDGGVLTEALESEAAIVVLDEFDRGPARLGEMLLGILDAGRLTDGRGRTLTFENVVLILTTNAGTPATKSPLPATGDLLEDAETALRDELMTPKPDRLGSPALWSRLQGTLVGYDYLRRDALDALVAKACRHLEANLGDELDLRPRIAVERFVRAIGDGLPPDGEWDGRQFATCVQAMIELPARERLEAARAAGAASGAEIELSPPQAGEAMAIDGASG